MNPEGDKPIPIGFYDYNNNFRKGFSKYNLTTSSPDVAAMQVVWQWQDVNGNKRYSTTRASFFPLEDYDSYADWLESHYDYLLGHYGQGGDSP